METTLCLAALVAMVMAASLNPVEDNNNLNQQEACTLVCNGAAANPCFYYAGNYVQGPSVARLCCLTTQVPEPHSLNVDYTSYVNESVFAEIVNWNDKPLPRLQTQLYLQCIRDCSLETKQVTYSMCKEYMNNQSICPRKRC